MCVLGAKLAVGSTATEGPSVATPDVARYDAAPLLDAKDQTAYDMYKVVQTKANLQKLGRTSFVPEEDLVALARFIQQYANTTGRFGLCHGTRRGNEQLWLVRALGWPAGSVLGTEISKTASRFNHTVQHDFHERNEAWVGKAAFVYSNALDHSYDPRLAAARWVESLQPGGLLVVEHSFAQVRESHNYGVKRHPERPTSPGSQFMASSAAQMAGHADIFAASFGVYVRLLGALPGTEVLDVLRCATRHVHVLGVQLYKFCNLGSVMYQMGISP